MTTKAQAVRALARMGFEFDESCTGKFGYCRMATIDAIGRTQVDGDCRGIYVYDYTATASDFWTECVNEARGFATRLGPCPHPEGECEFHDEIGECER